MIEIKDLSFYYGKLCVFKDFSLHVPEGQVCLLTGINGVGKSTLLRLIAGVLNPQSGKIGFSERLGDCPKKKIGFISDTLSLYESLKVSQAIDLHSSVYGLSGFDDSLIKHTKIGKDQKIKELSTGQKTIFHLSLVLSINPEIFLIDEVIHSIDSYLRNLFLDKLIDLISQKKLTVIMVNLNFHDIENIVERVILLKDGKIAVDEKIDELKRKVRKVTAKSQPKNLKILSQINFGDFTDYYVYPFPEDSKEKIDGEVTDLDLTDIITAFIGGEYV